MAGVKEMLKQAHGQGRRQRILHADVKKMRAGGKTNSDMLKMGRNLAKVANQKSPGRKQKGV
jgi:hypothetical protein